MENTAIAARPHAANLQGQEQDMVALIRQKCEDARARGIRIITEDWGIYLTRQGVWAAEGLSGFGKPEKGDPLGCGPLGALLLGNRRRRRGPQDPDQEVQWLLDVSFFWTIGFQRAYDGDTVDEETARISMNYAHGYHVGTRIRELVPPQEAE